MQNYLFVAKMRVCTESSMTSQENPRLFGKTFISHFLE